VTDLPAPSIDPRPLIPNIRNQIVKWAQWGINHHARFNYTEGPQRMSHVGKAPFKHWLGSIYCDCSAWVTYCYAWAGGEDPNGLNFDGEGYTGTLMKHGSRINVGQCLPGDVVVFGPVPGVHTALIIEAGNDPLTSSMGEQGQPAAARVSSMTFLGGPTFLRFSTKNRHL
jgi:hypothetical protein